MRSDMSDPLPGTSLPPRAAHDGRPLRLEPRGRAPGLIDDPDAFERDLAIKLQNPRQGRPEGFEKLADRFQLHFPLAEIDVRRLVHAVVRDVQTRQVQIARLGHPAERSLLPSDPEARTIDNPLEDAHVLAE